VVPAVGFGDQSARVLERSLRHLATGGLSRDRLVLTAVNRPAHHPPDRTMATARRVQAELASSGEASIMAFETVLNRRPRVGELRQMAVDAIEIAAGPLPPATTIVVADDDIVRTPADTMERLEAASRTGGPLTIGPVLFDDPMAPTAWFPPLLAGDLFRALVAERLVADFACAATVPDPSTFESIVLSCNLAVRRDALAAVGGFRDLNEIAGLLHDMVACAGPAAVVRVPARATGDALVSLAELAVRVSSRRALSAWLHGGHPTVAQWAGARFRSSRTDPVRVAPPRPAAPPRLGDLGAAERRLVVDAAARSIAVTLDHLQPPVALAASVAPLVGVAAADITPGDARSGRRWSVSVGDPNEFLARLTCLQDMELGAATPGRSAEGVSAAALA